MEKIIFASNNKGKIKEIKTILGNNVKSLSDIGLDIDIEETGKTFEENSLIKAREVVKITNKPTIADDSGLEIEYLNGEPGVYSARYLGKNTSYEYKNRVILERMEGVPLDKRIAKFVTVMSLVLTDGREYTRRGELRGYIVDKIVGKNGFAYDPIFYIPEFNKTIAEMSINEKNSISHRAIALMGILKVIEDITRGTGRIRV